jgi:hypothetical protein
MTQHTPGPWYDPTENAGKFGFPRWGVIAKAGDKIELIAKVFPVGMSLQKRKANARLIAAAPELLDALENLVIAIGMGWDLDGVIAVSEAAITKARGQS